MFVHIRGGGEAVGEGPWGGGAIEQTWSGLAKAGHAGVERLNALRIIPDLSHVSDPTALDVLETSRSPVVLSHGAARAIVRNARCAPDEIIRAVGESGGAMGIFMMSFWLTTDPEPSVEAYIRQIRHVINVAGTTPSRKRLPRQRRSRRRQGGQRQRVIKNYYAWWDSVAQQGVMGFRRAPAPRHHSQAEQPAPDVPGPRRTWAATGSGC